LRWVLPWMFSVECVDGVSQEIERLARGSMEPRATEFVKRSTPPRMHVHAGPLHRGSENRKATKSEFRNQNSVEFHGVR